MNYRQVMTELRKMGDPGARAGLARFGIKPDNSLGISAPKLYAFARRIGRNHELALQLWRSGINDARVLAAVIDIPELVTGKQMESWVVEIDSWDVCDGVCSKLFDKTKLAYQKAIEWSKREEEFVRRAGFVIMAALAVHDKTAKDKDFFPFFDLILAQAADERNFVRKGVNWALRQIGKRNRALNKRAISTARRIQKIDSPAARWISAAALRELMSDKVQEAVQRRAQQSRPR